MKDKNKETRTKSKKETIEKEEVKKTETKKPATKKSAVKKEKPVAKKENIDVSKEIKEEPKKENNKENISFCPNCGKKLEVGQTCDCANYNEPVINIDKDAIVEKGRGLLETMLNVYKRPYSTCKEESESSDIKNSMIILALISISMGLLISALTYASFHTNVGTFGSVADYYNVSYFKVFVVWSIVSFIMSFLPIVISCLASKMFSRNNLSFNNSVNLYAHCLSVVVLVNTISAIFIFAGLFVKFFLLISLLAFVFGFINYLFVYRDIAKFEVSKEAYIFLGIMLCWILGIAVIASLFTSGIDGLNAVETIVSTMNK